MLWGKYAQNKGTVIDKEKNLVLISAHPSPYSVDRFYNNHHFSRCNAYLEKEDLAPIDWH
jgi:uracil-DNA glycosylase